MSVNWKLPWRKVFNMLPEDMRPLEAMNEWVLWYDRDEWTEKFIESFGRTTYQKTYFQWLTQMYEARKRLSELQATNSSLVSNLDAGLVALQRLRVGDTE
jgi:hypothetical protein